MMGSRPRKTSGSPRDCAASMINVLIIKHPFLFSSAIYGLCMHYFFQGTAISCVPLRSCEVHLWLLDIPYCCQGAITKTTMSIVQMRGLI
jgi:hypothetical protein